MFSKILKEANKNPIHDTKNSPWCAVLKGSVASLIADKDMIDKLQNQEFTRLAKLSYNRAGLPALEKPG